MPMSRVPMNRMLLLALLAGLLWLAPRPALAVTCNARIDNFSFGAGVNSSGRDTSTPVYWQCERGAEPPGPTLQIRLCLFLTAGSSAPGAHPPWLRRHPAPKIGRATCWESVCQYA